jgi:uncharacterized protein YrzB (UPF0473 family)
MDTLDIEYLVNRLRSYPIVDKQGENSMMKHLLTVNGYNQNILEYILKRQKRDETEEEVMHEPKKKWVTFTYVGKETRYITKLFKEYNLNIT